MARLHDQYRDKVVPELVQKFGYKSVMQVPRITKITLNMGVGDAVNDKKNIDTAVADLTKIAGSEAGGDEVTQGDRQFQDSRKPRYWNDGDVAR